MLKNSTGAFHNFRVKDASVQASKDQMRSELLKKIGIQVANTNFVKLMRKGHYIEMVPAVEKQGPNNCQGGNHSAHIIESHIENLKKRTTKEEQTIKKILTETRSLCTTTGIHALTIFYNADGKLTSFSHGDSSELIEKYKDTVFFDQLPDALKSNRILYRNLPRSYAMSDLFWYQPKPVVLPPITSSEIPPSSTQLSGRWPCRYWRSSKNNETGPRFVNVCPYVYEYRKTSAESRIHRIHRHEYAFSRNEDSSLSAEDQAFKEDVLNKLVDSM